MMVFEPFGKVWCRSALVFYGQIRECQVFPSADPSNPSTGVIFFDQADVAQMACEQLNNFFLVDRPMRLNLAVEVVCLTYLPPPPNMFLMVSHLFRLQLDRVAPVRLLQRLHHRLPRQPQPPLLESRWWFLPHPATSCFSTCSIQPSKLLARVCVLTLQGDGRRLGFGYSRRGAGGVLEAWADRSHVRGQGLSGLGKARDHAHP
jgi:hypothetical protein